eukprot:CAMPEP_0182838766 /NCGR_PEP_ID=MMETSP0006_2-20121128/23493_1 /TAXON_ID=97485 /ORGANISM="Prymnesium parvum, Strain Texoma1" /LENGTH=278 /DNA_ID=CAMNT_0024967841 /DNA_START=99 /DNA_END=932 /DNA_ORIENTATION=+
MILPQLMRHHWWLSDDPIIPRTATPPTAAPTAPRAPLALRHPLTASFCRPAPRPHPPRCTQSFRPPTSLSRMIHLRGPVVGNPLANLDVPRWMTARTGSASKVRPGGVEQRLLEKVIISYVFRHVNKLEPFEAAQAPVSANSHEDFQARDGLPCSNLVVLAFGVVDEVSHAVRVDSDFMGFELGAKSSSRGRGAFGVLDVGVSDVAQIEWRVGPVVAADVLNFFMRRKPIDLQDACANNDMSRVFRHLFHWHVELIHGESERSRRGRSLSGRIQDVPA